MKILHLTIYDIKGGASRAGYRICSALRATGVDSRMGVMRKLGSDSFVHGATGFPKSQLALLWMATTRIPLMAHPKRAPMPMYSFDSMPGFPFAWPSGFDPDIIHLHWINNGFLNTRQLEGFGKPVVWTVHDMWPMTGGCHYSGECKKFSAACGTCEQLGSTKVEDAAFRQQQRKARHYSMVNMGIVCPSKWMASCADRSLAFAGKPVHVVKNPIDTTVFVGQSKAVARSRLGLPLDKKLVLFSSMRGHVNRIKGLHLLKPALQELASRNQDVHLVVVGADKTDGQEDLPFPIHYTGYISSEEEMASYYAAADVFVAPSLQDNLPNTVMESLSCATPAVAFNIGGMPDMIAHRESGYLATPFDVGDLATGIEWCLGNNPDNCLGNVGRRFAEGCTPSVIAAKYMQIYRDMV
ncbi:D-inositol 3-phosphate glycosyltransferase [Pontiella desulfatans]|uniref:D-inositol 3-phosphate glycosyltransferase n=1 Tax=Pontiella desulfatans TaxID=2750659 RepID=A0A6C2U6P9_PONDE|nr:glycosyltransferase family 4 protein [Pontiella desulfatans]VGO15605.1 D-inositol 3-phosphate glycosyltransferase [Pontiella desulfatans]